MSVDYDEDNLNQGSATVPISTLQALSNTLLFIQDRYTQNLIASDEDINQSMIRHTHLNRLTNISRREAQIYKLATKRDYAIIEIFTDEEKYDEGAWFKINSLTRNEELAINDSVDGWKVKELLKKVRDVNINEVPTPKRKWLPF